MTKPRIIFFGTPAFAALGLRVLIESDKFEIAAVVTQPDRPAGRGQKLQPSAVKQVAIQAALSVLQPLNIRRSIETFLPEAQALGPFDVGVVVAFGQILPQAVLDLPAACCVNTHASLLPRWRGAAPIQRAIMSGDTQTGVCLMKMEAGLDTGPVFSTERIAITSADTFQSLHASLAPLAANMLVRDLPGIIAGTLRSSAQSNEGITHAEKIRADEAAINWSTGAAEISRLVRALTPAPGAFTFLGGKRLKLFGAACTEFSEIPDIAGVCCADLPHGSVVHAGARWLVKCGSGVIELLELQIEGGKRMPVAEFMRGLNTKENSSFKLGSA